MKVPLSQIHACLLENRKTLAIAESCTGGMTSSLFTRLSGSSGYFLLGVVAYSNKAKTGILKIPHGIILRHGAVSRRVACLMARAARKIACSDIGIGITGIAGPSGGMPDKPVGTVFIALENENQGICREFHFRGNRSCVRRQAALKSLELLRSACLKK